MQSVASTPTVTASTQVSISLQLSKSVFIFPETDWRLMALEAIIGMSRLPKGSESWRLPKPTPGVRLRALHLIEGLIELQQLHDVPVPFVAPTSCAGIQFEWSKGTRELELEISADGTIEFLKLEKREPVSEGVLEASATPLFEWLLQG